MDFGLSVEQQQLKDSARTFLGKECPTTVVRKQMDDPEGAMRELYGAIGGLGWSSLIVPEEFGGAGLGMLDMAIVLEEGGYAALPGPFLFSSALAANALKLGGSRELNQRWLKTLAEGATIGTVAVVEANDSLNSAQWETTARKEGSGWILTGRKMFVPYGHIADFIVVAARIGSGPDDIGLFVVEGKAKGVSSQLLKSFDQTRRVAALTLENVAVSSAGALTGGVELYQRMIDTAAVAIAADSLGGTERALDMAVEYSKVREQFGKPIGSFQALKHMAAEIVADMEPARALLWYAAYAQDAGLDDARRAAAMAKARLCDIYTRASGRAVQMHGGIGFTWEHDIHLWFKRARFNDSYFGAPSYYRERLATLSGY